MGKGFSVFLANDSKVFPTLEPGIYQGRISGIDLDNPKKELTLYLEKIANKDKLLLVIFANSALPQVVPLSKCLSSDPQCIEGSFSPVELLTASQKITLTGDGSDGSYHGAVYQENQKTGKWNLQGTTLNQITSDFDQKIDQRSLTQFLNLRRDYVSFKRELVELNEKSKSLGEKYGKLKKFVDDRDLLKSRSSSRKQLLEEKIIATKDKKENLEEGISNLVSELDLLSRISKRGKIISLARNLAWRENSWYLANWGATEDSGGVEEQLARKMGLSIREVDTAMKKVKDIEALQAEIEGEIARINSLKAEYEKKINRAIRPQVLPSPEEKKTFFNKLFG